jgi:mannose/fructose/N-acetylgalactosamine-specific phosphotransferase system component IID
LRIKGKEKKAQHYEKEIESLRENPLFDDKFVPYDLRRLINIEQTTIRIEKKKGNPDISKNPKAISWKATTIGAIARGLGIGIFGSIPFVINASIGQVFWFYVSYLFVMVFTVLSQYLLTTYIIDNAYKNGLKTINRMQKELIAHLEGVKE